MVCGTRQGLYMPGMVTPPAAAGVAGPLVAPVVQAPQAASKSDIRSLMMTFVREGVESLGDEVRRELGQSMGAWMS
jgi:hypothetical protein